MESLTPSTIAPWSLGKKLAFRFFGLYFFLYFFTSLVNYEFDGVVEWLGIQLGTWKEVEVYPNGSGDTTFNYVQLLLYALLAFAGSLIWWVFDRKRKSYDKALYWLTAFLRYSLASTLISYGFVKIYEMQFPSPMLSRMVQPIGDSSPMGIVWLMMGLSRPYAIFSGVLELMGGMFLFFRRTTMFGCLFTMTVVANVVALNFCYDIPVKLFSLHLLLTTLFIVLPDVPRLWGFFFANKYINPVRFYPAFTKKWLRFSWIGVKALFIGWTLYQGLADYEDQRSYLAENMQGRALYGVYNATQYIVGKDTLAPLVTDTVRWQYLVLDRMDRAVIAKMNGKRQRFNYSVDSTNGYLSIKDDQTGTKSFDYKQIDPSHLQLSSVGNPPYLHILLEKRPDTFLLTHRKFRWVSEYPFNR